jgi:hypothetical protein
MNWTNYRFHRSISGMVVQKFVAKTTGFAARPGGFASLGRTCCETLLPFSFKWQPNIATAFHARRPRQYDELQPALVQLVEEARSDLDDWARATAVLIGGVGPDRIRGRICRMVILTPTTSLHRMWQAEELFRRGARTLSQDLDRHFQRLPLLVQRRYLQFDPCDRGD